MQDARLSLGVHIVGYAVSMPWSQSGEILVSIVDADGLVLKHQAISIHNAYSTHDWTITSHQRRVANSWNSMTSWILLVIWNPKQCCMIRQNKWFKSSITKERLTETDFLVSTAFADDLAQSSPRTSIATKCVSCLYIELPHQELSVLGNWSQANFNYAFFFSFLFMMQTNHKVKNGRSV